MELPDKVKSTVNMLRKEHGTYIAVMFKKDRYYAYEAKSSWNKDKKRASSKLTYIGKVEVDGRFIPARKRNAPLMDYIATALPKLMRTKLNSLKEVYNNVEIETLRGDKAYLYFKNNEDVRKPLGTLTSEGIFTMAGSLDPSGAEANAFLNDSDKKILSCLSMNARMPLSRLSKEIGISQRKAYYRVRTLEKKLCIKYTCEINVASIGYVSYLVFVKFDKKIPEMDKLRTEINNNPKIQFAAMLKGDYDMVFYLIDEDPTKADINLFFFRSKSIFEDCDSIWHLVPFDPAYSFIPLREDFFENILSERNVLNNQFQKTKLRRREMMLIRELNKNSVENFKRIDKKLGWSYGASRYIYNKLLDEGVILRPTVNITIPIKYVAIIIRETLNPYKLIKRLSAINKDLVSYDKNSIINKYLLEGRIGAPAGVIYFLPVRYDGELEETENHLKKISDGAVFKSYAITEILTGALCYRRYDGPSSLTYFDTVGLPEKQK